MPSDHSRESLLSQAHQFADPTKAQLGAVDELRTGGPASSFWADAWRALRRRPLFWVSVALIIFLLVMALFPSLFTSERPGPCPLARHLLPPEPGHPFGFDSQGCDIMMHVVYGARTSLQVGVLSALAVALIGTAIGLLAGYYGGWVDAILARVTDIFFALPIVLAAVVVMQVFRDHATALSMVAVIAMFAWTSVARIARGAAISTKQSDFVTASRALGLGRFRILLRHILPNSLAPIIITATTQLGTFIVLEATLSFLGIGLPTSIPSWGHDIATAQKALRIQPEVLFYPAGALALTVLAFIMLGDVVRDALDPKSAKR
ncbi:MAG: ABC transporter permease [Bifidobacteriaceae bacterium]|jgi:oligopeptide transport system permease protein|nr:ABC transporter permease [Bifidobacteriaceae bacterium]